MLVLICGRPRAGKTTYSQQFISDYKIVHMDEIRSYEKVMNIVKNSNNIVIDGIFSYARIRKILINSYTGKYKKCVWLDTSFEIRKQRVNYSKLNELSFEPPTLEEGWDEIIIIRGDNDVERISR